jgi:hypothetical protein
MSQPASIWQALLLIWVSHGLVTWHLGIDHAQPCWVVHSPLDASVAHAALVPWQVFDPPLLVPPLVPLVPPDVPPDDPPPSSSDEPLLDDVEPDEEDEEEEDDDVLPPSSSLVVRVSGRLSSKSPPRIVAHAQMPHDAIKTMAVAVVVARRIGEAA